MNGKTLPNIIILIAFFLLPGCSSREGAVLSAFPEEADPGAQYLIYIHGRIIEEQGIDPISPEFGLYEFSETLEYFADQGFVVIGEVRTAPVDVEAYVNHVGGQISRLIAGGVRADRITVLGFSKGALITLLVSDRASTPDLNFVLVAICSPETTADPEVTLSGRVLSLYERSDTYGASCQSLADRSPGVMDFQEIAFDTGRSHGAFYPADPLWMDPVLEWINSAENY